jgi:hypothetical protein
MIHQLTAAYLLFTILTFGLVPSCAKASPTTAEQLRGELESALKARDANAVMSLFNWQGGSNDLRGSSSMREMMIKAETDVMLRTNVISVRLLPLPKHFLAVQTNGQSGILQRFNVDVVGLIDVESQTACLEKLPYGKAGVSFYIAGTSLEKIPGQSLCVQVSVGPNPDLLPYTGSWVYVEDGKEIRVDISDKTNRFKTCWGDYIKSCTVQRTSTNSLDMPGFSGWFYFDVLEGGRKVFESSEITNEKPVTYQRKTPSPYPR